MVKSDGEHYLSAFDHIQDGFQVISRDWRYLYVNSAVIAQSKYHRKEDLLGFTMMEKFPGIDQTPMFSALRSCMENRKPQSVRNEFVFPDGSKGWFELRVQPVPEGIFILSHDITEKVKTENERLQHIHRLERMLDENRHHSKEPND
jgi:PAS domain S-box-containing protein